MYDSPMPFLWCWRLETWRDWRSAKSTSWRITTARHFSPYFFWKCHLGAPWQSAMKRWHQRWCLRKIGITFLFMNNLENKLNCILITTQLTCLSICARSQPWFIKILSINFRQLLQLIQPRTWLVVDDFRNYLGSLILAFSWNAIQYKTMMISSGILTLLVYKLPFWSVEKNSPLHNPSFWRVEFYLVLQDWNVWAIDRFLNFPHTR